MARLRSFPALLLATGMLLIDSRSPLTGEESPATFNPASASPTSSMTLNLADCLQLALQRQPRIAAQRASLAAAEEGSQALENLMVPTVLVPDLSIRRKQACAGISAAAAGVDQAERETVYAVTRTYFTLQYAREQERLARGIVDRLAATRDAAKRSLDAGARDVSATDVNRATVYLRLAGTRQTQASQGAKRALAALKEAIGLGPEETLQVPPAGLPDVTARPSHDEVLAQALARRAELVRAGVFVEVTCLEADAQATHHHKRVETFAAGSDIHAITVPQGTQNNDYRPGGVAPEMPTLLVGSRADRVKRAQSFNARAQAVADTTRNLIALEAEDAFLRWEEAALQIPQAREAAEAGDKLAEDVNRDFTAGLRVKVEDVVNGRVLASQARSQYNEFLYRQILALADLERITGGAFNPHLAESK
jgi:outer membrane protein TolC